MFIAPDKNRRAFTLLEIMLAIGILSMMALAIYRFVQTNIIALRVSSKRPRRIRATTASPISSRRSGKACHRARAPCWAIR